MVLSWRNRGVVTLHWCVIRLIEFSNPQVNYKFLLLNVKSSFAVNGLSRSHRKRIMQEENKGSFWQWGISFRLNLSILFILPNILWLANNSYFTNTTRSIYDYIRLKFNIIEIKTHLMYGILAGTWYFAPGSKSNSDRSTGGLIPPYRSLWRK